MGKFTKTSLLVNMSPDVAIKLTTTTYETAGTWAGSAKALGVSEATLRLQARSLGFKPGAQPTRIATQRKAAGTKSKPHR